MTLQIVTYITDDKHPLFNSHLLASCEHHGLKLVVLKPTRLELLKSFLTNWIRGIKRTNVNRVVHLYKYLRKVPDDDIILFSDGYDTFMLSGAEEILEKYYSFNHPLVFSTEANCWPDPSLASRYLAKLNNTKFLNAGGFIGRAGDLKQILKKYRTIQTEKFPKSDQYRWHLMYLMNPDSLVLDQNSKIFICMATSQDKGNWKDYGEARSKEEYRSGVFNKLRAEFTVKSSRLVMTQSGKKPCHIHFNGRITRLFMSNDFFIPLKPWFH